MADVILEPYAARQRWSLPAGECEGTLVEYVEALARRCAETGPCLIGHIKALALFPNGSYFRVSVVAPDRPATLDGGVPPACTELILSLNIIVYGIERSRLEAIARATAAETAAHRRGEVTTDAGDAPAASPLTGYGN